jgi:hypothetical protein
MSKKLQILSPIFLIIFGIFLLPTNIFAQTSTSTAVTIAAAGDIAQNGGKQHFTSQLVKSLNPYRVLTLGDNVYENGTLAEFNELYAPSWGQFAASTEPSPGNHEYNTPGAAGYFDYFGPFAGPDRRGYYSFNAGNWHVVSLNSEVLSQSQLDWLRQDLSQNTRSCILAYWHKPLFSSGSHSGDPNQRPFWDILYQHGADLVLNGHDHNYERFAKQNPSGLVDPNGIRQFIVGTGGAALRSVSSTKANSEAANGTSHGVLLLTLRDNNYDAEFKPAQGYTYTDSVRNVSCNPGTNNQGPINVSHVQTTISPVPTLTNGSATIATRIANSGSPEPFLVDIEVYNSAGSKVAQKAFNQETIPTGGSKNYEFVWTPTAPGDHTVKVGLFTPDWSRLHQWTNRALAVKVESAPTPVGFAPKHLRTTVSPSSGDVNQIRRISTTVENSGEASSMLVDIEVFNSVGDKVGQKYFDNQAFAAGATRTFDYEWEPKELGGYRVAIGHFRPGWSGLHNWINSAATATAHADHIPPTSTPPVYLYREGLEPGWDTSWSWNTAFSLNSTDVAAAEGTKSIKVNHNSPWAGIYFRHAPFSTTGKTHLRFAVHGGPTGGQKLQVITYDENGNVISIIRPDPYATGGFVADAWKSVSIPLADIRASNRTITGFAVQEGGGGITPTYYIDNMRLE